jgi:UDP-glucose 4-epimerase
MILSTKQPTILVTGGAGYIGSHVALLCNQKGYRVIVLDTFRHRQHVPYPFEIVSLHELTSVSETGDTPQSNALSVVVADYADKNVLSEVFEHFNITTVIHCAALIEVGESVKTPRTYYNNNVIKTFSLLETMLDYGVNSIIFSSSCAVYGVPQELPISESHPKNPISPYGKNKLMVEMMLEDFASAYNLHYVALRYFNAAGAMPDYGLYEQHQPESHLIPLVLRAATEQMPFTIFGNHYPTPDGTCIRDYVHVWDIAHAHHKALEYLGNGGQSLCLNLGTGQGYSVQEIIAAVEKQCATTIHYSYAPQRPGDPAILTADSNKARDILAWKPIHSDLYNIISSINSINSNNCIKNIRKQSIH